MSSAKEGVVVATLSAQSFKVKAVLRDLLQAAFAATEDLLFRRADQAETNQEQNAWFDAMSGIRLGRRQVDQAFFMSIEPCFRPQQSAGYSSFDIELLWRAFKAATDLLPLRSSVVSLLRDQFKSELSSNASLILSLVPQDDVNVSADLSGAGVFDTPFGASVKAPALASPSDSNELDLLLYGLQIEPSNLLNEGGSLEVSLRSWLSGRYELTADELATLSLVSKLFEVVLEQNPAISKDESLLWRLRVPILRLALRDATFIADGGHPARRLLNEVIGILVSVADSCDASSSCLAAYKRLGGLVDLIEETFSMSQGLEVEMFESFLVELNEPPETELQQQRLRQAEEGKAKAELARRKVKELVKLAVAPVAQGKPLPSAAERLLRDYWHKVMLLTYLTQGESGSQWREQMDTAKALVWSVCADLSSPVELMQKLPWLLTCLRKGVDSITHDPFDVGALFKELEAVHIQRLQLSKSGVGKKDADLDEGLELDGKRQKGVANDSNLIRTNTTELAVANFIAGSWFDVTSNGVSRRVKLAAVIPEVDRFIFVDRNGVKTDELNAETFSLALEQEAYLPVAVDPLFDRALESVITGLRSG